MSSGRSRLMIGAAAVAFVLSVALFSAARQYPPDVPAPKSVVLPVPAVRTLPNGLKVLVVERHSLPLIALRLVVKDGAEADPASLPGTAQLLASMLQQGTRTRTARQIAEAVDQAGSTIQTGAEWDNSFAALTVLSDQGDLGFDLLSDMVIHPALNQAELERQRKQSLSALQVLQSDPAYLADAAFNHFVFSGTPYSHPSEGTAEALGGITRADLRAFYEQYYRPSNSVLAVAGDIAAGEAFALADHFFGSWKEPQPAAKGKPKPDIVLGPREIVVIDKPNAVQTEIRIGSAGIRRTSPEYDALTVANQVLGGPATNRLFKALRSQHGLTYGASSDLLCYQSAGTWVAKTSTRTPETIKAVELVLDQLKRLRDDSISRSELELTQSYLAGHLALDFESTDQIATQLLELVVYGLPLDYWNRFSQAVFRLNAQDVGAVTREYLDPDRAIVVLVGNAAAFEKDLNRFGRTHVIPVASVDFGSASLERAPASDSVTGSSKQ